MVANFLALTAGLAATASAFSCEGSYFSFYNRKGVSVSAQRLDTAVQPGVQSAHLHNFDGGNGITLESSFADLTGSTCTTARIKADKSLYWRPALYWNGNGTGYYRVPEQLKTYYKYQDGEGAADVSEFPEDFQMIVGDNAKRADDGKNPGGIRWACHQPKGAASSADIYTKGAFPTGFTGCGFGLASEATFPTCWNGEKIDPKNPSAHMAYTTGQGKGVEACPEGFRKARFPTIFIEFWYDISAFDGHYKASDNPWVLSNGDPTGFGFHADFKNGWEKGVLAKAVSANGGCRCGCGCDNKKLQECFGADGVNDEADKTFAQCAAKPVFPGEDALVLQKLPGCNPIQAGPGRAVAQTGADCSSPAPAPGSGSGGAESSSAAAPAPSSSASKPAPSSSKAASSKTRKGGQMSIQTHQPAPSVKAQAADANVVYVTQTLVATQTVTPRAARRHRRHAHGNRMI